MKTLFLYVCCLISVSLSAQTTVNKSYPVTAGQAVSFSFDRPKSIHISTWDRNEVSVKAVVSINQGDNDTAFELVNETENGRLIIRNNIKNLNSLPKVYTVMRDGNKTTFRSKEDYQTYVSQNRSGYQWTSEGVDIDVSIEINVPANSPLDVYSLFGSVAMENVTGPVSIKTTHGGIDVKMNQNPKGPVSLISVHGHVDVSMSPAANVNLKMSTTHGEILASPDFRIDMDKTMSQMVNYSNKINGKLNAGGADITLSSTHNKIYLRKS